MHRPSRWSARPVGIARALLGGLLLTVASLAIADGSGNRAPSGIVENGVTDSDLAGIVRRFLARGGARDYYARLQAGQRVSAIPAGSLEEAQEEAADAARFLADLSRIPVDRLGTEDRLSFEILRWSLGHRLHAERDWWYEFPVTTYTTFDLNLAFQALAANPLADEADRDAYRALLASIATRLETSRGRLARQAGRGIRLPAPAAGPAAAYFAALDGTYAALPADAGQRAGGLSPEARERFIADVRSLVDGRLQPARAALVAVLETAAREGPPTVGLAQYPGGREVYRDLARFHTSLQIAPEAVRDYGESRILRINAEIDAIARELRIEGGRAGIRAWLRDDARFIARSADDVAARYRRAMARIVPKMPEYFARQPKAPFGVRRLDPAAEGSMTFGYYQAPTARAPTGEYRFNGSRLEDRSLVFAAPIIYHELLPGHHFQVALQLENESLPPFRRSIGEFGFNAYTEGWAEYAAELAGEMGLYDDPHDRLGRLMLDAFLSARLVVDSGLNYFGWSLEQARRYMFENTYQSENEIATETLRYSTAIPGQALGYKMGQRVFDELRAAVQARRGQDFDLREFHSAVLDPGAMPLSVLQQHLARTFGLPDTGTDAGAPAPEVRDR